jgi:hypothetical protein
MTEEKRKNEEIVGDTDIIMLLDKSWSMGHLVEDTIGGCNNFIEDQRTVDGVASVTRVLFAGSCEVQHEREDLHSIPLLTCENYQANGSGTALRDAIGKTIILTERSIKSLPENKRPSKVIFVIITDGEDNSSREFSKDNVCKMIESKESDDGWAFVFLAANQDAITEGGSIGVRASHAADYSATKGGTRAMYQTVSKDMTAYRSKSVGDAKKDAFFSKKDLVDTDS